MRPDRFGQGRGRDFTESPGRDREGGFIGNLLRSISMDAQWAGFPSFLEVPTLHPFRYYPRCVVVERYTISTLVGGPFTVARQTQYDGGIYEVEAGGLPMTATLIGGLGTPDQIAAALAEINQPASPYFWVERIRTDTRLYYDFYLAGDPANILSGFAELNLSGTQQSFEAIYRDAWDAFKTLNDFSNSISTFYDYRQSTEGSQAVQTALGSTVHSTSIVQVASGAPSGFPGGALGTYYLRFGPPIMAGIINMVKRLIGVYEPFKTWEVIADGYDIVPGFSTMRELSCAVHPGIEVLEPREINEDTFIFDQKTDPIIHRFGFPPDTSVGGITGLLRPSCAPEIVS